MSASLIGKRQRDFDSDAATSDSDLADTRSAKRYAEGDDVAEMPGFTEVLSSVR